MNRINGILFCASRYGVTGGERRLSQETKRTTGSESSRGDTHASKEIDDVWATTCADDE
jgi:hypothetical protein